jgi:hypothetical protein
MIKDWMSIVFASILPPSLSLSKVLISKQTLARRKESHNTLAQHFLPLSNYRVMSDIAAIRESKLVFYASLSSDISLDKQKNSLISRINRVHKTDRQAKEHYSKSACEKSSRTEAAKGALRF